MKKIITGLMLSIFLIPSASFAAEYKADDKVYIDQPFEDDLYLAGSQVRVRTNVMGDLFLAGNTLIVDGQIAGDVFAGGSSIDIKGELNDDVRAAGQWIKIDSEVSGDVMVAGETISIEENAAIGGDFFFAGTEVRLEANVAGDIRGTGQSIYFNSEIKGNVYLYQSGKIAFGPKAKILGNLTYSAPQKIEIPQNLVGGKIVFKNQIMPKQGLEGMLTAFSIYSFLSTLFIGSLLIVLVRFFLLHNTKRAMEGPLKSLGVGFLILAVLPLASLIFMFTWVGIPLGLILFVFYFVFLYIAKILAAMLIGHYLLKVDEKSSTLKLLGSFILGLLIYMALGFIPYVGWALKFLIILIALGGLYFGQADRFREMRKKKLV